METFALSEPIGLQRITDTSGVVPICDPLHSAVHFLHASGADGCTKHETFAGHVSVTGVVTLRESSHIEWLSHCESILLVERLIKRGGFIHFGSIYMVD